MEAEEVDRREKMRQQLFKQGGWGLGSLSKVTLDIGHEREGVYPGRGKNTA